MKPTLSKLKNLRGRITGHVARFAGIRAEGVTPAEAVERCETFVRGALQRLDRGTLVGVWHGHAYVISPDTVGWRYWIDTHSRTDYSVSMPAAGTREEAQDAAMFGLAQGLWTPEVEDDVVFTEGLSIPMRKELLSWIAWQRRHAAAVAAGKSGNEAHAIASGLAS